MSLFRKPPPPPQRHPDPATELKLRSIAAIDQIRQQAARQIGIYQDELVEAQRKMNRAPSTYGITDAVRMGSTFIGRIARAEAGIRQQQEIILTLGQQIEKSIAESGLTDADLSYLNLE